MIKQFILDNPYEVFSLLTLLGALYHWIQKASKGEASFSPVEYWLKDTPGYTAGTLVALLGAWWAVVGFEMLDGMKWQAIVAWGAMTGYTLNSSISKGAGSAAADAGGKIAGFIRLHLIPLLIIAAFIGTAFMAAGCAGLGPQAAVPKTIPEQIEAANLLADKLSDAIVDMTCTQFQSGECVEPGKPLMPKDAIASHAAIEQAHTALSSAASIGAGQVGECMGSQRTQSACLAAVNAILLEIDRALIAKRGSH